MAKIKPLRVGETYLLQLSNSPKKITVTYLGRGRNETSKERCYIFKRAMLYYTLYLNEFTIEGVNAKSLDMVHRNDVIKMLYSHAEVLRDEYRGLEFTEDDYKRIACDMALGKPTTAEEFWKVATEFQLKTAIKVLTNMLENITLIVDYNSRSLKWREDEIKN